MMEATLIAKRSKNLGVTLDEIGIWWNCQSGDDLRIDEARVVTIATI